MGEKMANDNIRAASGILSQMQSEIGKVLLGKEDVVRKVLISFAAGGHVLLEDIPGVGKTTLALALAKATDLKFSRLQFTPDVVPSDITGFTVYRKETGDFVYREGAAMTNILLADEINRTSSKTQSALLEVMQENAMTVDGERHEVPQPFFVIATENPASAVGVQHLPEAELDRFMMRLSIGYPDAGSEIRMMKERGASDPMSAVRRVATARVLIAIRQIAAGVYADDKILKYIRDLSQATRDSEMVTLGVSPRGSLALLACARAAALFDGRDYTVPEDIADVFIDCAAHRIRVAPGAVVKGMTPENVLEGILKNVKPEVM